MEISLRADVGKTLRLMVTQSEPQGGSAGAGMDQRIVNALVTQLDGRLSVSGGGSIVAVIMPYPEAQP